MLGMMASRLLSLTTLAICMADAVLPADITVETWRGKEVLRLTGSIDQGTAAKLEAAIGQVAPAAHGLPILLLDSPGGSVVEALAMSRMMDEHLFHTVVPDGASCASACTSILFIAGSYRTVEPFGLLGQHSCSNGGTPDQACNDALAKHAVAHGVPYGGVAAFVTYTPPDDILNFTRQEADGWGLTRYPGERESGYRRSDPLAIQLYFGAKSPAQAAWRLDFREDGFRAFLRPAADDERELQLNLFCEEILRGRLFLSMEIHGPANAISESILSFQAQTDGFVWEDPAPIVWQMDPGVSEVITEIPRARITPFLTQADQLAITIRLRHPFDAIRAETSLSSSREVLRFAANNCPSGTFGDSRAPLR